MKRRTCLALLAGTAGCVGAPGSESSPSSTDVSTATDTPASTTRVPMGRSAAVGDARVTLANPRVRKAVRSPGPHAPVVRSPPGQFVVVDVTVDDGEPDTDGLGPSVDGDFRPDRNAVPTTAEGTYAIPFPAARHDEAAVGWRAGDGTAYWTLPAAVRETLATEPVFGVESFEIPRHEGHLRLELTVANEGTRDGRFLADVSMAGFSGHEGISFPVPAGESRTYAGRAGSILAYFENSGGGTLTVRYPGDGGLARVERSRSVE